MNLELIQNEFDKYVNLFDMNNYNIKYKYNHSYRVMKLSNMIATSLNLSNEDILLATVIGLLHDIGRFKQLEMFNSYDDKKIDHADLGVKILFEDNLIDKFCIDRKYYDLISFAIKNHNKFSIENTTNEKKKLHSKIIRDADKIDILRAYIINKEYKLPETTDEISNEVKTSFYNNGPTNYLYVNNPNDKIILVLSFIFDINYKVSFDNIKMEKFIEKFYDIIENKNIFDEYFKYAFKYLNDRGD